MAPKAKARGRRNGQASQVKVQNGNGRNGTTKNGTTKRMAPVSNTMPLMVTRSMRRATPNKVDSLSGSDFLTRIRTQPAPQTSAQRILAVVPVTPSAFPGTRLTQMSQLYDRYRFTKFRLRYIPAIPMTLGCQYVVYLDTDPLDDATTITNPDALVRQATAQAQSHFFNFNEPQYIDLAIRKDDQLYYTGDDKQNVRFSRQAVAYVIQVTDFVNYNGELPNTSIVTGSLYVDWSCNFSMPQLNPAALTFAGTNANAGIGTTSSSDIIWSPAQFPTWASQEQTVDLANPLVLANFSQIARSNTLYYVTVGTRIAGSVAGSEPEGFDIVAAGDDDIIDTSGDIYGRVAIATSPAPFNSNEVVAVGSLAVRSGNSGQLLVNIRSRSNTNLPSQNISNAGEIYINICTVPG